MLLYRNNQSCISKKIISWHTEISDTNIKSSVKVLLLSAIRTLLLWVAVQYHTRILWDHRTYVNQLITFEKSYSNQGYLFK